MDQHSWESLALSPGRRIEPGSLGDNPSDSQEISSRTTVVTMDLSHSTQQFLTAMRARLTPEEAGVPIFGGERRVPGLRREEVAQLAGVSTAYYTRMERGNLRGVSDSVLHSLARTLQLNDVEAQHLFDLARNASNGTIPTRRRPQSRLTPRVTQLMDMMPDVPTVALGRVGDILGSNALGRALFPHLFPEGSETLNHTRYLFLDDRSRDFYVDWGRSARHSVSVLRLLAGKDPSDRAVIALVGELATHSAEFRTWWAGHTVNVHATGYKTIRHPIVGELTVGYETLTLASDPDVKIGTYVTDPGSASADALDLLRSWMATSDDSGGVNLIKRQ